MRKVLSFVLVLSLVLGSFGMAFAAETTTPNKKALSDVAGLACEDAVRVLTSLSVVSGYEDGTYKPEQTVTRAEMASLIIKALGLKETDAVPKFADSKTHWAKGYIAYANTLGIISGRSETVFDPDATVTYDEATTMLIKALGYTDEALNGVYPASYVSMAKVLGILDNIQTGTAGANRGDVAIMLYQTLDQAIGKVDKDGNFVKTEIKSTNTAAGKTNIEYDTMMARLGVETYKPAGRIVDAQDNSFILTRSDADDALINAYPYIGAVVSAYINDDDDIIAIKEVFSTFINGTYKAADDQIKDTQGNKYDLANAAAKNFKYNTTTSAVELLNGVEKTHGTLTSGSAVAANTYFTFAVDLSGKNIKQIYSISQWYINAGQKVDKEDLEDIEDNKLLGYEFPEDDNGKIDEDAFELVGAKSLSDIKDDMVVYVYSKNKTTDKEITRIAVGSETVSGVVTKASRDGDEITIDGKTYKFAAGTNGTSDGELEKNGADALDDPAGVGEIDVDDEVKLYLDAYGFIYDYDKIAGDADKFAIVLDAGQSGGFKSDYQVELFLADGTTKIFTIDDDKKDLPVTTAGASSLKVTDVSLAVPTQVAIGPGSLIKYGLNKSGEINSMEVYEPTDRANKVGTVAAGTGSISGATKEVTKKGYWDSKLIKSDAVIFTYDGTDLSDDDNYDVAKLESVLDSDKVAGYYFLNSKNQIEGVLLAGFETTKDVYGAVTDWSKGANELLNVEMYIDGAEKNDYKADMSTLGSRDSVGKIYKLKFNANGEIKDMLDETTSGFQEKAGFYQVKITSDNAISVSNSRVEIDKTKINSTMSALGQIDNTYVTSTGASISIPANNIIFNLDGSVAVYKLDGNGDWSLEKKGELKNVDGNDIVRFYNTDDDDYGVTTVVVIEKH